MKIERISEDKLRVTIPLSYFVERDMSIENFEYNSEEAQEFFLELMETLDEEYGFNFLNSQMLIEAYPGKSNDIVFNLTRVNDKPYGVPVLEKRIAKRKLKKIKNVSYTNNPDDIFMVAFKNFDDICNFVSSIHPTPIGFNSLYKLSDKYFLVINKKISGIRNLPDSLVTCLNEFGEIVRDPIFYEGYLNEYGKIIILGSAVEVLYAYFSK